MIKKFSAIFINNFIKIFSSAFIKVFISAFIRVFVRVFIIGIMLIILWESIILLFKLPSYILPSPFLIGKTFCQNFSLLISQTFPTLIETISGFIGAVFLGSLTALLMSYFKFLNQGLRPLLLISQALPTFALAPIFVIWLGYGMSAKIAMTTLMLYFPIASNLFDGLTRTPSAWLDMAYVVKASRLRTLFHIRLPAALPSFTSGLRIAAAGAPMGAVIGEWVGSSKGLGFLMLNANARMQTDLMFAALAMLILWSLCFYFLIDFLARKYINWKNY